MTQHEDLRSLLGILARQGAGWIREQLQAQGTLLSPEPHAEGTQASVEAAKSLEERGVMTVRQAKPREALLTYDASRGPNWYLEWEDETNSACWLDTGIAMIPGDQALPLGALLRQHNLLLAGGQDDWIAWIRVPKEQKP